MSKSNWLENVKPQFLGGANGPYGSLFNYRRIWALAVLLIIATTITPLGFMGVMDYNISKSSAVSEARLRTARIASNARRSIAFNLEERVNALRLVSLRMGGTEIKDSRRLAAVLKDLKESFGGFVDLGVIDASGVQRTYAGPFQLALRNYSEQPWFSHALKAGQAVSEVFLGYRNAPHHVVAVRMDRPGMDKMVLRATLDTERFNALAALDLIQDGDSFIINAKGVLQTPSRHHGHVLERIGLPVPAPSEHTETVEVQDGDGNTAVISYAYIEDSPFIVMVVKPMNVMLQSWQRTRMDIAGFLAVSATVMLLVIIGVSTYLVNRIYYADMNRAAVMHQAEHSNKLASIGRLAAGVAHEINNPLAVINEKAGLIRDLLTFSKCGADDARLPGLLDSILGSVERCGAITKRLLGFARHLDVSVESVDLGAVLRDVLGFLHKEAEYRDITVNLDVAPDLPPLETDRGKLQQILLNLVNNAFAAMDEGGRLDVTVAPEGSDRLRLTVADNGCGISKEDMKRIFEPFYSTRKDKGGTGLGLSITYGLVEKLGGAISVESALGQGTAFTVTLPLKANIKKDDTCEYC